MRGYKRPQSASHAQLTGRNNILSVSISNDVDVGGELIPRRC
jgi:hypothetical protein